MATAQELVNGQCYVAVGTEKFKKLPYLELSVPKAAGGSADRWIPNHTDTHTHTQAYTHTHTNTHTPTHRYRDIHTHKKRLREHYKSLPCKENLNACAFALVSLPFRVSNAIP